MSSDDNQDRQRDLQQRIASLIHANAQAPRKPIPDEDVQKLKAAAGRLDHLLQAASDAEAQALKDAAARLDQLLADIRAGKDLVIGRKRRPDSQKKDE